MRDFTLFYSIITDGPKGDAWADKVSCRLACLQLKDAVYMIGKIAYVKEFNMKFVKLGKMGKMGKKDENSSL